MDTTCPWCSGWIIKSKSSGRSVAGGDPIQISRFDSPNWYLGGRGKMVVGFRGRLSVRWRGWGLHAAHILQSDNKKEEYRSSSIIPLQNRHTTWLLTHLIALVAVPAPQPALQSEVKRSEYHLYRTVCSLSQRTCRTFPHYHHHHFSSLSTLCSSSSSDSDIAGWYVGGGWKSLMVECIRNVA